MSKSRTARVNSTGRKKIAKKYIYLEILDGIPRRFKIKYDFPPEKFPPESEVFLEVFLSGASQISRFRLGTVTEQNLFEGQLDEVSSKRLLFNLKVVKADDKFHHILGLAEHIQKQNTADGSSRELTLLVPERRKLGDRLWKLETFEGELLLLVNESFPGFCDSIKEPKIAALLYPAILRDGLLKALGEALPHDEGDGSGDEEWQDKWIRLGKLFHPNHEDPPSFPDGCIKYDEAEEWIDPILENFSKRHRLFDAFRGSEGEEDAL